MYPILDPAFKKLWSQCVTEHNFEGRDTQIEEEIMSMGGSVNQDIDGADIEEVAEDQEEAITVEELIEFQSEKQNVLVHEHPLRTGKIGEVISDVIKPIMENVMGTMDAQRSTTLHNGSDEC